jgi:hypothetical protein
LIRNKKTIVLFERNWHATEKSVAIVCARISLVIPINRVVDPKSRIEEEEEEDERHTGSLALRVTNVRVVGSNQIIL